MNDRQTRAAGILCLTAVLVGLIALAAIMIENISSDLVGNRFPGSVLMALMSDDGLASATKWVSAILGVGAAALARDKASNAVFLTIVIGSTVGALLSVILLIALKSPDAVHRMSAWSQVESLTDPDTYKKSVNWMFGGLAIWFGSVLSVQLGIKLASGEKS